MESGGSIPYSQGLLNNPYPEPNQPNYRIDTYLFKVHSNIVLPKGLFPSLPFFMLQLPSYNSISFLI